MADATPTPNPTPTQIVHQVTNILPIINGHNLTWFITLDPPAVPENDLVLLTWLNQDHLLLGWIYSSMTETVQSQLVSYATTKELWTTLTQIYTSTSRARHTDLHRQLQTTSKGSSSCSDFLQKMRHIADELRFIRSLISYEDFISSILNGLGAEYNSFVVTVTTNNHHAPPTYPQIHTQLLAHEA
ncbi:uncharacterized protein LOC144565570 [Carex rostrata]